MGQSRESWPIIPTDPHMHPVQQAVYRGRSKRHSRLCCTVYVLYSIVQCITVQYKCALFIYIYINTKSKFLFRISRCNCCNLLKQTASIEQYVKYTEEYRRFEPRTLSLKL